MIVSDGIELLVLWMSWEKYGMVNCKYSSSFWWPIFSTLVEEALFMRQKTWRNSWYTQQICKSIKEGTGVSCCSTETGLNRLCTKLKEEWRICLIYPNQDKKLNSCLLKIFTINISYSEINKTWEYIFNDRNLYFNIQPAVYSQYLFRNFA